MNEKDTRNGDNPPMNTVLTTQPGGSCGNNDTSVLNANTDSNTTPHWLYRRKSNLASCSTLR